MKIFIINLSSLKMTTYQCFSLPILVSNGYTPKPTKNYPCTSYKHGYINTDVHTHIDRSVILSQVKKRSRQLNYNIACKFFFDHVSLGTRLFHFADFSHPYCLFSDSVWWLSSVLLVFPTIYPGLISPLPLGSTLGSLEISVWFSVYLWNLLLKTLYLLQESYCLALL